MPRKKIEKDEAVYTEAEANEDIIEPTVEPLKVENNIPEEDEEETSDSLTLIEKFNRLELGTKTGLTATIIFLLAVIFRWNWFNSSWWLVLILAAIGLKTLYTQMTDLREEKPEEAKVARYSFITLIVLVIIRDLYITYHLGELLDDISKYKEFIK